MNYRTPKELAYEYDVTGQQLSAGVEPVTCHRAKLEAPGEFP